MGQPDIYWQDYRLYKENSPMGCILLPMGPTFFAVIFLLYMLSVLLLTIKLPKPINIAFAITIFLSHVWGGVSWVPSLYKKFCLIELNTIYEWHLCVGYFIIIAVISSLCLNTKKS